MTAEQLQAKIANLTATRDEILSLRVPGVTEPAIDARINQLNGDLDVFETMLSNLPTATETVTDTTSEGF